MTPEHQQHLWWNNQYGFWDGWLQQCVCVCVCVCVYTRNSCHIHVLCAARLAEQRNYSRLRGFILGVCCVIVAPPHSLSLGMHWMICREQNVAEQDAPVRSEL